MATYSARSRAHYNLAISTAAPPWHIPVAAPEPPSGDVPRRVLLLAYRFPPASNAIASRRPEGLYRHLGRYGWEATVVTTRNESGLGQVHAVLDKSIAGKREGAAGKQLKPGGSGPLTPLRNLAKRVAKLFPQGYDAYARWSWDAARAAIELGQREKFDVVWATLSPLSLGPAAVTVARALGVPCVLDLRDPPDEGLGSGPRAWFTRALRAADAVTVAAPSCITPYLLDSVQEPLLVLSGAWNQAASPQISNSFRIVHAGTWHPHYAVEPLLQAATELAREIPDFSRNAKLIFVGKGSSLVTNAPSYAAAKDLVEILPLLSHAEAQAITAAAGVLLIARSPMGYKAEAITGKLFDYAAYETPLLSIGGRDDLHAALVRWLGGLWTSDAGELKGFLREAYLRWKETGTARVIRNPDALAYLNQQRMAAEMATVLTAAAERQAVALRAELPWPQ